MRSLQTIEWWQPTLEQTELYLARPWGRSPSSYSRMAVYSLWGHPQGYCPQGLDLRISPPHQRQTRRENPIPFHFIL